MAYCYRLDYAPPPRDNSLEAEIVTSSSSMSQGRPQLSTTTTRHASCWP